MKRFGARVWRSFRYRLSRAHTFGMCVVRSLRESTESRTATQTRLFREFGLDRAAGLTATIEALRHAGLAEYDEDDEMFSEHLVLFGAVSRAVPGATRVMEIGTYDGRSALLLSHLFPAARILTFDLPESDAAYHSTYAIARTKQFIANRTDHLSRSSNIEFVQKNSLALTLSRDQEGYDVIWVDGDHTYPVVAIDIANAVRMLKPGGFLMCDDILVNKTALSSPYVSLGAHEALVSLSDAGLIHQPTYVRKRLGRWHQHPRRYVAISRRR